MALMKKTAVTILLILLVFSLPASSLFVGIGGGRTYNRIIAGENYTGYEYLSGFGWKASLPVTVECTPSFGFETGVSLTEKTYRIFRETHGMTPVDVTETNLFVTVPATLRVSVKWVDNVSLFLTAGGYAGFYLGGKRDGKVLGMATEPIAVSDKVGVEYRNRYEYGVTASLGYTVDIDSLRFSLALGYSLDLSDIHKGQVYGNYPLHNSTFDLSATLAWRAV